MTEVKSINNFLRECIFHTIPLISAYNYIKADLLNVYTQNITTTITPPVGIRQWRLVHKQIIN